MPSASTLLAIWKRMRRLMSSSATGVLVRAVGVVVRIWVKMGVRSTTTFSHASWRRARVPSVLGKPDTLRTVCPSAYCHRVFHWVLFSSVSFQSTAMVTPAPVTLRCQKLSWGLTGSGLSSRHSEDGTMLQAGEYGFSGVSLNRSNVARQVIVLVVLRT